MANDRKIERVAKAICQAAGRYFDQTQPCRQCYDDRTGREDCNMWKTFEAEAIAALKAAKGF